MKVKSFFNKNGQVEHLITGKFGNFLAFNLEYVLKQFGFWAFFPKKMPLKKEKGGGIVGKKPTYKGVLQKSKEVIGSISLWKSESKNKNYPILTGTLTTEKASYRIALWEFKSKKSKKKQEKSEEL